MHDGICYSHQCMETISQISATSIKPHRKVNSKKERVLRHVGCVSQLGSNRQWSRSYESLRLVTGPSHLGRSSSHAICARFYSTSLALRKLCYFLRCQDSLHIRIHSFNFLQIRAKHPASQTSADAAQANLLSDEYPTLLAICLVTRSRCSSISQSRQSLQQESTYRYLVH